jgi:hypothetical protein
MPENARNRRDHYLPQGYLKGFIDPARKNMARPFWMFDLETKIWSMESPGSVGWERGFYDYADGTSELEHSDLTFKRFEDEFPNVRDHLLQRNFKGWAKQQKPFLLEYMQMMRARSPLYISQKTEQHGNMRMVKITEVISPTEVKVDTLEPYPPPAEFVRNRTITAMREEIQKGADWMGNFNWCLRYTRNVAEPFVTGTQPITVEGRYPDSNNAPVLDDALKDRNTVIWFPLCWQACLVGALDRFDEGTAEADPSLVHHVRELFFRPTTGYVISPSKIESF